MTPRIHLASTRVHPDVASRLAELADRAGVSAASVHRVLLCRALGLEPDDMPPVVDAVLSTWDVMNAEWREDASGRGA